MLMGKTLNKNVMCAMHLKTTGPDINEDVAYNICIMPLDMNYNPIFGSMFERYIQTDHPKVKVEDRVFARKHTVVWDQLDEWIDDKMKKSQIIPIVYDWPLTLKFMEKLFSEAGCKLYFIDKPRDIKSIANFLNDQYEANTLQPPFSKTTLRYILNTCDCSLNRKYNSLEAAFKISQAYKKLVCLNSLSL